MSDTLRRPYEELHTENQRLREALHQAVAFVESHGYGATEERVWINKARDALR